ncbi:SDR family NAD(P)-dependent oxidoreductase [Sedimentitalea sp. HM32M-2]|uniref:SDR family NAD(P)-dependent oxidoreductase n=1 Tax=Sedimentitalea sp. HM32M-2 TaxID=3351566 RepID=UPI003634834B
MRQALIIGRTGGIGGAVADRLTQDGWHVTGLSRRQDGLDLTNPDSVDLALRALDTRFDLILVATGALAIAGAEPEKSLAALTAPAMLDQFALNAVGPALILRHAGRLLIRDRRSVFAALSARVGSIGDNRLGGWISYRAAKAALNQVIRTAAIELARSHAQAVCVALHPGTVATPMTRDYLGRHAAVPAPEAARNLLRVIDRLDRRHSGGFFDWAGKPVPW